MRKMIAALQVSLDGLIEGPNGEVDWIGTWEDSFDLRDEIDACVLGGGMYAGYEQYWTAILADREGVLPLTGRPPTEGEISYAHFADRTPHYVLSRSLDRVEWQTSQIVREISEIDALKKAPGKAIHAVGGAALVSNLMNEGLIDELRLTVHPIVLGQGTPLFKDVSARHSLELVRSEPLSGGRLGLIYRT